MVDFLSQTRLHGLGHCYVPPKDSPTMRDIHRDHKYISTERRPIAHNCRHELMQDYEDKREWESYLMADGLRQTYDAIDKSHRKESKKQDKKDADKLLFDVGQKGSSKGNFYFPRGLAINSTGDIHVADTRNNRIQVFNSHGVLKFVIGERGSCDGKFMEPTGVGILPNDDVVVCDTENKRVQVLNYEGQFKFSFDTCDKPFDVSCDSFHNIAVSTFSGTIELFRRGGKFYNRFSVGDRNDDSEQFPVYVAVNDKGEVVVSDPNQQMVKYFSHEGSLLYKFQPVANADGLSFFNAGLCINRLGQVIIADKVNHTVNLFSERGKLLLQLVGPTDDAGSVQTCMIGPEGHLVATEYTANGRHCLKIFRYRQCECHLTRPRSSKRTSPAFL